MSSEAAPEAKTAAALRTLRDIEQGRIPVNHVRVREVAWLVLAEVERLHFGIREVLEDLRGAPCAFWACPGVDHPSVAMATCDVCDAQQRLHELLGDPPPTCTAIECSTCRRESPWCETCDVKLSCCEHGDGSGGR